MNHQQLCMLNTSLAVVQVLYIYLLTILIFDVSYDSDYYYLYIVDEEQLNSLGLKMSLGHIIRKW